MISFQNGYIRKILELLVELPLYVVRVILKMSKGGGIPC